PRASCWRAAFPAPRCRSRREAGACCSEAAVRRSRRQRLKPSFRSGVARGGAGLAGRAVAILLRNEHRLALEEVERLLQLVVFRRSELDRLAIPQLRIGLVGAARRACRLRLASIAQV